MNSSPYTPIAKQDLEEMLLNAKDILISALDILIPYPQNGDTVELDMGDSIVTIKYKIKVLKQ